MFLEHASDFYLSNMHYNWECLLIHNTEQCSSVSFWWLKRYQVTAWNSMQPVQWKIWFTSHVLTLFFMLRKDLLYSIQCLDIIVMQEIAFSNVDPNTQGHSNWCRLTTVPWCMLYLDCCVKCEVTEQKLERNLQYKSHTKTTALHWILQCICIWT